MSLRHAASKAAKPALIQGAHEEIMFSNEGKANIFKVLANAVGITLGPKLELNNDIYNCIILDSDAVSRVFRPQRHY